MPKIEKILRDGYFPGLRTDVRRFLQGEEAASKLQSCKSVNLINGDEVYLDASYVKDLSCWPEERLVEMNLIDKDSEKDCLSQEDDKD